MSSYKSTSKSGHVSKPNSSLFKFAGILQAIIAASAKRVPPPHIGSIKSLWPVQPAFKIIPAANTSLIGAKVFATL